MAAEEARAEVALARRAAHGDEDAFQEIVAHYEGRLLAFLMQMLGDLETARDVLQETLLAAFRALAHWQPPPDHDHPLAPWLYRIATNRALSALRAEAGSSQHMTTRITTEAAHPTAPAWEDSFVARELVRQALKSLAADDAACLVLHFVAGERYGEIADRLGLTSEAVRKRVARGLVALRAAYAALDVEVKP